MALAVTPDGSAVTGYSFNTLTGNRRGLVWSGGVMTALEDRPGPDLDLSVDDNALPEAISDDGRTVVGVGNGTDGRRLGRWVDSQIEVLWNRRLDWSMSLHVLSDRRIISVSMGRQNRHTGESYGGAMVWRAGLGITSFEHYAAFHHGLDLGLNAGARLMLTTMTPDGWHFGVWSMTSMTTAGPFRSTRPGRLCGARALVVLPGPAGRHSAALATGLV